MQKLSLQKNNVNRFNWKRMDFERSLDSGVFVPTREFLEMLRAQKAKLETKPRKVDILRMQDESLPRVEM